MVDLSIHHDFMTKRAKVSADRSVVVAAAVRTVVLDVSSETPSLFQQMDGACGLKSCVN